MHSDSWSLVVTRGHSWSLVVTRGLLVVTRGHSWSLVCTFRHDRKGPYHWVTFARNIRKKKKRVNHMSLLPLSVVCVNPSDFTYQHVRNLKTETMVFIGACFPFCSSH